MFEWIKRMFAGGMAGRYQVDGVVLRHAFFTISTGRDKKTMRPVLVKEYTQEGMEVEAKLDANYRERPRAEMLPELANRFVVKTIETGVMHGKLVEILEAGPVTTLREMFDGRRLSLKAFRKAMMQVGEGLAYLHSHGYVHRGISPESIAVTAEGDAKIIDVSLLMDAGKKRVGGTMVGPTGYVAPEVIRRGPVDARSDIYSLGAVCYEAFSGTLPFPRGGGYEGLVKMINSRPTPLSERNAEVGPELNAVVMKALAKTPEARWQTVEDLMERLAAVALPEGIRAKVEAVAAA